MNRCSLNLLVVEARRFCKNFAGFFHSLIETCHNGGARHGDGSFASLFAGDFHRKYSDRPSPPVRSRERMGYSLKPIQIRFVSYLVYVLAFGYFVIKADDFNRLLKRSYESTYDFTGVFLFMSLFPIIVGILLALPQFFVSYMRKGSWKVDWVALLAMGLPALLVAITPMLVNLSFEGQLVASILLHPSLVTVAGILFGFVLVTSFNKQESE